MTTYSIPTNKDETCGEQKYKTRLFPVISISAIILNVVLANTLLFEVWHGVILWSFAGITPTPCHTHVYFIHGFLGLLLFCRCESCNCEGLYPTYVLQERVKLHGQGRGCSSSNTFPMQYEYDDHMEAVLISR